MTYGSNIACFASTPRALCSPAEALRPAQNIILYSYGGLALTPGITLMATRDPFESSVMARPAIVRLGVVTCVIIALWLAIAWAAALA